MFQSLKNIKKISKSFQLEKFNKPQKPTKCISKSFSNFQSFNANGKIIIIFQMLVSRIIKEAFVNLVFVGLNGLRERCSVLFHTTESSYFTACEFNIVSRDSYAST